MNPELKKTIEQEMKRAERLYQELCNLNGFYAVEEDYIYLRQVLMDEGLISNPKIPLKLAVREIFKQFFYIGESDLEC